MKFGDILGSISPAYGLLSGDGLGQYLKYLSPAAMLIGGIGGHGHGQQPAVDPTTDPTAAQTGGISPEILQMLLGHGQNFLGGLGG